MPHLLPAEMEELLEATWTNDESVLKMIRRAIWGPRVFTRDRRQPSSGEEGMVETKHRPVLWSHSGVPAPPPWSSARFPMATFSHGAELGSPCEREELTMRVPWASALGRKWASQPLIPVQYPCHREAHVWCLAPQQDFWSALYGCGDTKNRPGPLYGARSPRRVVGE